MQNICFATTLIHQALEFAIKDDDVHMGYTISTFLADFYLQSEVAKSAQFENLPVVL